jgi:DNA-binding Lrp family transcriptional regulator
MISELDKRIIKAFELDAESSYESVALALNVTPQDVEERLIFLRQAGIIGLSNAVINTTKLGLSGYGVFVKIKDSQKFKRDELVVALKENPFVYWISTNKQVYEVIFAVQARDSVELNEIISHIVGKFSNVIERYDLASRLQFNHFHRKYLSFGQEMEKDVIWGNDRPVVMTLSENERHILSILSAQGDMHPEDISQKINLPASEIGRIIKDLEDKDIITGYHLVIHPDKYGYQTYQFLITSFISDKQFSNSLLRYCSLSPNITVLVQSLGMWNYEITAEVDTDECLRKLLEEIRKNFPCIKQIQVIEVENYYEKYCLGFPPISESVNEVSLKDVRDDDFVALKEIVRRRQLSPFDFEYCEGYLVQAVRNFPKIAYLNSNMAFVTKKLPEQGGNYVIVLADGFDQIGVYKKMCRHLYQESLKSVIIKNVGEDLEIKLKDQKYFRGYGDGEIWDDYAKYDDNTYPQIIIHNKKFLDLEGPEYQKLREKLNWFDRRYNLEIITYSSEYYDVFDQLLDKWAGQMYALHGMSKNELIGSHQVYRETKNYYFQYLLRDKKSQQWVGYLCASTCSELVCGFNALLNDFNVPELYRKMMYKMIEISSRLGFTYTNLQGSETLEQFKTKEWFVPEKLIHKKHLVYDEEN